MPTAPICSRFRRFIHGFCAKLSTFLLACMLLVVALQVAMRDIFGIPMPWAEESSVYMMVSLALYGSVFVLHEKGHLRVESIVQCFSNRVQMVIGIFLILVQALFVITVVWFSLGSLSHASRVEAVSLGISMFIPYLVLPIAFSLIFIESIFQLIDTLRTFLSSSGGETL